MLFRSASRKGKEKEGTSRRYSKLPPVPTKAAADQASRRSSSALAGPTSPPTISITTSSPLPSPTHSSSDDAQAFPSRKPRKKRLVSEAASATPSLSSLSSATSSPLATPTPEPSEISPTVISFPFIDSRDSEEDKPPRAERARKPKRRALAPVEEVLEVEEKDDEDDAMSPQALFFDATEMPSPTAAELPLPEVRFHLLALLARC